METTYKIFGERFLVEKEMKNKLLSNEKEFTNIVKVLGVGEKLKDSGISVGDRLLVTGVQEVLGEVYVLQSQILRWVQ